MAVNLCILGRRNLPTRLDSGKNAQRVKAVMQIVKASLYLMKRCFMSVMKDKPTISQNAMKTLCAAVTVRSTSVMLRQIWRVAISVALSMSRLILGKHRPCSRLTHQADALLCLVGTAVLRGLYIDKR